MCSMGRYWLVNMKNKAVHGLHLCMGQRSVMGILPPPSSLSPIFRAAKQDDEPLLGTKLNSAGLRMLRWRWVQSMAASVVYLLDPQYREEPSFHAEDQ